MQPNDTAAAIGILQAAILAIPFWLTSTQYWLRQAYEEGDSRYKPSTAILGTATSIGLLALLLAVRYSSGSILTDAGGDVAIAIRLIDLFTVVVFGMLVATMGQQMAADDNAKLAFKYTMTFSLLAPATIFIYIFRSGWMIYGIGIILLAVITVYGFKIRPWIIAHTRKETDEMYPAVGAATIGFVYRIINREKIGPITPEKEEELREILEARDLSNESIEASIEQLRERYGTVEDSESGENGIEEEADVS